MPVLLLIILLLFPAPSWADADLFSFAKSLAAEGDHYRAITEYKRFLYYYPEDPRAPQAQLAIAKSLLAGKRWQQLDRALEKVWQRFPDSPEALEAHRLYAEAAAQRKDFAEARVRYRQLKEKKQIDPQQADYQIGLSYFEEERPEEALKIFARLDPQRYPVLQQTLDDYRQLPYKSSRLAGTLSALLPGAGQLYCERPRQAAVAFALNAAFIYGAIEAWNNDNYAVAGLVSLFEVGWYGGNIYNAVNNAERYNRRHQERIEELLRKGFSLSFGIKERTPWLQAKIRF